MNRTRTLIFAAGATCAAVVTIASAAHPETRPQPMQPAPADLIEWQQGCYRHQADGCSSWEDQTVTAPVVAEIGVPLACDHERCSTDPSEIPGVTR